MTPLICRLVCALAMTLTMAIAAPVASAKVLRLEVTSTTAYGRFAPGEFVRIEGTAHGEIDPSEKIPGLQGAARSASGGVALHRGHGAVGAGPGHRPAQLHR